MAKSKSSNDWLREHFDDPYVKKAQKAGYRSRATFKLEEIDKKDKLIKPGMSVVDLGSAPGGWSDYALRKLGDTGTVVALDILRMTPLSGVHFIEGDFREDAVLDELNLVLNSQPIDLVLSDMAPNISGIKASDQAGIIHLNELALQFSTDWLKPNGCFLVKSFVGAEFDGFVAETRKHFEKVTTFKPASSRDRSSEIFVFGRNKI